MIRTTISTVTCVLAPPLLVLISVPLAGFALVTSSLAFSTLLVRVLMVYIELGVVIAHNYATSTGGSNPRPAPRQAAVAVSPIMMQGTVRHSRSSRRSSVGNPAAAVPDMLPTTPGEGDAPGFVRDYEGVGGWRIAGPGEDDDDAAWQAMNSRLELPAAPERKRRHRRSLTSGSENLLLLTSTAVGKQRRGTPVHSPDETPVVATRPKSPFLPPHGSAALGGGGYFHAPSSLGSSTPTESNTKDGLGQTHTTSSSSTVSSGSSGKSSWMLMMHPSNA
ncbi:MAG: hypothetical protein M1832_001923 [Thelocarpon impressellum]|nr:MAG: hypothetical protein M1832_001923 [Thelocarpon impressellum]